MVAHKIGRILNGDPTYEDSAVDIVGYATLMLEGMRERGTAMRGKWLNKSGTPTYYAWRNRRIEFKGETKTLSQWAEHLGLRMDTLSQRLRRMSVEEAMRPGKLGAPKEYPHGHWRRYESGCRCPACCEDNAARARARRAKSKET